MAADHMFIDFLTGLGPRNREFGPSSAPSQLMASSPGVAAAVSDYNKGKTTGTYVFGASGAWDAGANPIQQYVGSYQWSVFPVPGGLDVRLSNFTSVHSGSYHLVTSHNRSTFGPAGTTHQNYDIFVPCKQ